MVKQLFGKILQNSVLSTANSMFEEGESDRPIIIEADSTMVDQQVKEWASKGIITKEEAHENNEEPKDRKSVV